MCGVNGAVEDQIDEKISDADELEVWGLGYVRGLVGCCFGRFLVSKEHEHANAGRDQGNHEILVRRKFTSIKKKVHEHDGNELAGLPEDHSRVCDIRKRGEAEWSREGNESGTLEVTEEEVFTMREKIHGRRASLSRFVGVTVHGCIRIRGSVHFR